MERCDIFLRSKDDNMAYPGLFQHLPIPNQVWWMTLMVVDRMTKCAHFIALSHPYTAATMADVFWKKVHCLHGTPESIVTDMDKVFLWNFLQSLFKVLGTQLHYSTTYHPQSDGQTERVNKCLENYLGCMTASRPTQWKQWPTIAEWCTIPTFTPACSVLLLRLCMIIHPLSYHLVPYWKQWCKQLKT